MTLKIKKGPMGN